LAWKSFIELLIQGFELGGVIAILVGALLSLFHFIRQLVGPSTERPRAYAEMKEGLGRAILVGLELLVAADIIRTIAIEPTIQSVVVLGLIVIIRTFLSWSLEVEVTGQWPWRRAAGQPASTLAGDEN
jgi:uncharacterized membrane protein